jgi:phosphonate transport system substrate-binding protein
MSPTFNFAVSPDFPPDKFSGWYMLNTYLQRKTGLHIHLLTSSSFADEADWIASGKVHFIYSNPFMAEPLIRQQGFVPVAQPLGSPDEVVIATKADSPYFTIEALPDNCRIAATSAFDVKLVGLRLLEPANISEASAKWVGADNYPGVAKALIQGNADAGLFLAKAWHALSGLTKRQLSPLVESRLDDLHHVVLAHPSVSEHSDAILAALAQTPADILEALGLSGFAKLDEEDAEFLIDVLETLKD